jgi:NTE family protein
MQAPTAGNQGPSGAKLGLALSGGGFRASFFHLGVLAQLASRELLRQVEVLSTVSGGSIIGALYYLQVKKLLEGKADQEITGQDYVNLVANMEQDFLLAVQSNLRMRTFSDFSKNLRMFQADYSRSDRIGELYDELLYRPVMAPDSSQMIQMRDLKIAPRQPDGSNEAHFSPRTGNACRQAKVPILLINATTLNTGHNWRFEAARMGEPERALPWDWEIDSNARLLRADSYEDLVKTQQDFPLGQAVAASACVPGVFHPLAVSGLYPDYRLQLVDGGVHDNQGIQALLDLGCRRLVISDASGQMQDVPDPSTFLLGVLMRTNSILMDRVREEQLLRIINNHDLQVALVHLRQGLVPQQVPYIDKDGNPAGGEGEPPPGQGKLTAFGVAVEVQELLAGVRTDLDSFTDVEAYSLMLDGYLMSGEVFDKTPDLASLPQHLRAQPASGNWRFEKIKPWMAKPTRDYLRQLKVAGQTAFKIFRLNLPLGAAAVAVGAALTARVLFSPLADATLLHLTVGGLIWTGLLVAAWFAYPWLKGLLKRLGYLQAPARVRLDLLYRGLTAVCTWGAVKIHLALFDPWFLRRGTLDRLKPPAHD